MLEGGTTQAGRLVVSSLYVIYGALTQLRPN